MRLSSDGILYILCNCCAKRERQNYEILMLNKRLK